MDDDDSVSSGDKEPASKKQRLERLEKEEEVNNVKWNFLEHRGPYFPPPYKRLPPDVKFYYGGEELTLSTDAEEVATFYAKMLDHDYTKMKTFNANFFRDWRNVMTEEERAIITQLSECNFEQIHSYFKNRSAGRIQSQSITENLKKENERLMEIYGYCTVDGHKEKIANFKLEPPGLFRGRGDHPKMGSLKRRVMPEDVVINCSEDSVIPEPPEGHEWKDVRHNNRVSWLACWTDNVLGRTKYIMLSPSSTLKGEDDLEKYETARKLAKVIDKIRYDYRTDWVSTNMAYRQRAVAMYFIDKLALRIGNKRGEDMADTVGCCSLRVEHIRLSTNNQGTKYFVAFDFLGKDSIRYYNEVQVAKIVYQNLELFMDNKSPGDNLFDRLTPALLNKHLNELMEGLTAKVFRTYNASHTLEEFLVLTDPNRTINEKVKFYKWANRAVALLCNHKRTVPKTHSKSMNTLIDKIVAKHLEVEDAINQFLEAENEAKKNPSAKNQAKVQNLGRRVDRLWEQVTKLEQQAADKEEFKFVNLTVSKVSYVDPRITVAWCKRYDVPIEKIYSKAQREKFAWAIDRASPDFVFTP